MDSEVTKPNAQMVRRRAGDAARRRTIEIPKDALGLVREKGSPQTPPAIEQRNEELAV
jgi:hypothetical protein